PTLESTDSTVCSIGSSAITLIYATPLPAVSWNSRSCASQPSGASLGKSCLIVVTPDTVVRWHRPGFRLYWTMICKVRKHVGGRRISKEIRDLIFQMVSQNPTWGAPRIHGELLMLGFDVSERTISRWMRRAPRNPEPVKR